MGNLNIVKLAGITLIMALALSLGVGTKAAEAQTLFGLAHSGSDGWSRLHRINPATGRSDPIGRGTGFQRCSGMDFDASGTLFATCERASDNTHVLITIDPSTGEGKGEEVGPTGVGTGPWAIFKTMSDISFRNLDGAMFAYLKTVDDSLYFPYLATIDIGSAAVTLQRPTVTFGNGNGIAFSPEDELFHADEESLNTLNTLDLAIGVATPVINLVFPGPPDPPGQGCCNNIPRVNSMDFQPGTGILFASVNDKLLQSSGDGKLPRTNFLATIDTTTGNVTIIGKTVKGLDAIAFAPAVTATPPVKADTPPVKAELGSFKCYGVKRPYGTPKFEEVEMMLDDEFDSKFTRVKNPESICVPVSKDISEISDATSSLTCYKIKDVNGQPKFQQLDVEVWNELYGEGQALTLKKAKVVCVPSTIEVP